MLFLLCLLLLCPALALGYTFDPTVLNILSATYGVANEACESPTGSDVTLSPGGAGAAWETAIESASPGARFFLNAGTYGSTAVLLDIPNGTSGSRITIKPNNCAAVTITARIQPGNYTTLAGMTLSHITNTTNAWGLSGTVWIGPSATTGVIIRNNFITADDHYAVYVASPTHTDLLISGNELRFPNKPENGWNVFYIRGAVCNNCTFTANKLSSLGVQADLMQAYNWGGSWTLSRNLFGQSVVEGNHLDIKYSTVGATPSVMTVLENYFDGTNLAPTFGCAITHQASDACIPPDATGCIGPNMYAYTVHAKGNYFKNCPSVVWDHRISQRSSEEIADKNSRTLNFTYNVVDMDTNQRIGCESYNCLVEHNTFLNSRIKAGSGSETPQNVVVRNNIHYNATFENPSKVTSCSYNNFHNAGTTPTCSNTVTGNPLFINAASNWDLQTGSPSRGTSSTGSNRGAVTTVPMTPDYASGMVMHLPFDENTGTHAEDSIADFDGTLSAGASWGLPKNGVSSVALDGTANGVVTVSGLLGTPASITLAAWIKRSGFPTTEGEVVSLGNVVALRQSATGLSGKYQSGVNTFTTATSTVALGTDWHHVAYTVTPGVQKLYVDGLPVGTTSGGAGITWTGQGSNTLIGAHGNGINTTFRFQGTLDNVRVYSRALTDADMAGLAAAVDTTALALQITSPTPNPSLSVSSATLSGVGGQASGPLTITGVSFSCATCSPTSGAATGTTSWTLPTLTLTAGTHLLTVTAVDGSSTPASDTLTVTYTEPPVAGACTHYASQAGGGNGLSVGSPWTVVQFLAVASAGQTLCLLDGTYTGGNSMIVPSSGRSGTASLPITVRGLNDGAALLDGQNVRNPVVLGSTNQWWVIQGLNAKNGLTAVYEFLGANNRGSRVIGWNATTGQANATIFTVTGTNTIVEDCAGWGNNARIIFQGSGTTSAPGTPYRRCWGEWNDAPGGTSLPGATYQPGKDQRLENVLGTVNRTGD